jgi:8-oxo-dGTP diphosphatase
MYSYIYTSQNRQCKIELYFSSNLPSAINISSVRLFVLDASQKLLFIQEKTGIWDLPEGRLKAGESVNSAAIRELYEEANVNINSLEWIAYEKIVAPKRYQFICYGVARVTSLEPFVANEEAIARKFFNKREAIQQDGILFGNRHTIFDRTIL